MPPKVSIIGSGFVGAEVARRIVERELADVILLDILEGIPQGKGLDILESGPLEGFARHIHGTNSYSEIASSDIVVVTAGLARKPGMSREDLLLKNASIVRTICENVRQYSPQAILLMVTNPLDIMAQLAYIITGFVTQKVLGMAGILDSARFSTFVAEALHVAPQDVKAMVLGGHGDAMLPLPRYTTVSGIPITELLSAAQIEALIVRTRDGGAEIVKYLKEGSAYYAPSSGVAEMVESILRDQKRVIPASTYLTGQYGLSDVFMGVPVKLGANGVEEIYELELTKEEQAQLKRSADIVKENSLKVAEGMSR